MKRDRPPPLSREERELRYPLGIAVLLLAKHNADADEPLQEFVRRGE